MVQISKSSFLTGAVSLLAAPAVIRVSQLMPIRAYDGIIRRGLSNGGFPGFRGMVSSVLLPSKEIGMALFEDSCRYTLFENTDYLWNSKLYRAMIDVHGGLHTT